MIAAIVLSIGAWIVGYVVWRVTGSPVLGAASIIIAAALELALGVLWTRK